MVKTLNDQFVCVKVDGDQRKDLVEKYHVDGFPNIVFTDAEGEMVYVIGGFMPAEEFLKELAKPAEEAKKFAELKEALAKSPDDAKLNFEMGQALGKRGKHEEAKAAFEKVSKVDPENKAGYADDIAFMGIDEAMQGGDFAAVEGQITAWMEKYRDSNVSARAYLYLGFCQVQQEKVDDALKTWKTGVEKYPDAEETARAKEIIAKVEEQKAQQPPK